MKDGIYNYLGIKTYQASHTEKLISALGAFIGILLVFHISHYFLQGMHSYLVIASMGASAVLLFALPHSPLSQPWSLIGGHLVAATIGVVCAKVIPDIFFAASLAVGITVAAMYYLRCIHPPGGATALSAVVGGSAVHELGFQFVLTPVLINVLVLACVAIAFNYLFHWRRYPAHLAHKNTNAGKKKSGSYYGSISHEDFVFALSEFDSFIDISEDDLLKIYSLVTQRHKDAHIQYHDLKHGHYYSNGEYGDAWSVRKIVNWVETEDADEKKLIYKTVAGSNRLDSGMLTKTAFSLWAKHEVVPDNDNWQRVDKI